jgi:ABC-type nitrate/sulfonate/bicarbonate transport system substrate-binding protein
MIRLSSLGFGALPRVRISSLGFGAFLEMGSVPIYWLLFVGVLVILAGCGNRPSAAPLRKVSIGVYYYPGSAALLVAQDKGFFRDAGLDATLVEFPVGKKALDAALTGKVDLATVAGLPIAAAALDGKPVAVVATIARGSGSVQLIARRDRGIARISDLKGKRIGVESGTAPEFGLYVCLTTGYVDPADVTTVDLPAEDQVDAIVAGKVDAVCAAEPVIFPAQKRLGSNAVFLPEPGFYTAAWNLAVGNSPGARDPEIVARVLRAIIRANDYIRTNTAEALAISAPKMGMDTSDLHRRWSDIQLTADLNEELILELEDQARWLDRKQGGPGRTPNFLEHIYPAGLRAVRPEAVRIAGAGERQ